MLDRDGLERALARSAHVARVGGSTAERIHLFVAVHSLAAVPSLPPDAHVILPALHCTAPHSALLYASLSPFPSLSLIPSSPAPSLPLPLSLPLRSNHSLIPVLPILVATSTSTCPAAPPPSPLWCASDPATSEMEKMRRGLSARDERSVLTARGAGRGGGGGDQCVRGRRSHLGARTRTKRMREGETDSCPPLRASRPRRRAPRCSGRAPSGHTRPARPPTQRQPRTEPGKAGQVSPRRTDLEGDGIALDGGPDERDEARDGREALVEGLDEVSVLFVDEEVVVWSGGEAVVSAAVGAGRERGGTDLRRRRRGAGSRGSRPW